MYRSWFDVIAGVASILSLALVFLKEPNQAPTAIALFLLIHLIISIRIHLTVAKRLTVVHPKGYSRIASFVRYTCTNGVTVNYELQKVVQCKQAFLVKISHRFKWTGQSSPAIVCEPSRSYEVTKGENATDFENLSIALPSPLLYGETAFIRIKMTMTDNDQASLPIVAFLVDEPIAVLNFRVELGAEDRSRSPAVLEMRKLNDNLAMWQLLKNIDYDPTRLCYEETLINPDPGIHYRLIWTRNAFSAPA